MYNRTVDDVLEVIDMDIGDIIHSLMNDTECADSVVEQNLSLIRELIMTYRKLASTKDLNSLSDEDREQYVY